MNRLITAAFFIVLSSPISFGQTQQQTTAAQLQTFESQWLTAGLNDDRDWLERFFTQKLAFVPTDAAPARERIAKTLGLIDPTLRSDEYKIRIAGTISFLTSDASKNRSFSFLDTFNKRGGKWQVIASNLSPAPSDPSETHEQIQNKIIDFEKQFSEAFSMPDPSIIDRLIAPDFVGTSTTGNVLDRQQWLAQYKGTKQAASGDLQVRIYAENLAVATGTHSIVESGPGGSGITYRDRFTDTWMLRNGQWQCIASHVSRLP